MNRGFAPIPDVPLYRLTNARVPVALASAPVPTAADPDGLARIDLTIGDGRILSLAAAGGGTPAGDPPAIDLDGGLVLPRLVDVHTHLDKGHIWPRRRNPDGSFLGALDAAQADREAHWTAADVAARMDFSLRCAFAHGTGAIRTHLDCVGRQTAISWPVFAEMRAQWRSRLSLQAVSLFPIDVALDDEAQFRAIVAMTARHGGILGGVTYLGTAPDERTDAALDRIVQAAAASGLDLDFHVDESHAPEARTLVRVAAAARRNRFSGAIVCGHCCSLALMDPAAADRVIAEVAEAGIAVVSLPMCNLYLQDRQPRRTPRWRGVTALHELEAASVPVMVASDNTRDPFYPYGDLDMIEVFREATRILHLDHADRDWIRAVAATPAAVMGLSGAGRLAADGPADLILTRARSLTELMARPQSDRTVLVAGRPIDTAPPDHRELDPLLR